MKLTVLLCAITWFGAGFAEASPLVSTHGIAVPPDAVTAIHGCHSDYAHDIRGWHRHGKGCETQRGLTRLKRNKQAI